MIAAASIDNLERFQPLANGEPPPSRRMLVIVNPYATTVSDRLRNLVVYALRGRYDVTAVDTEARNHATQLARHAARDRFDVVVAFGGDGTVNEAANGLAGAQTALFPLPGGRANVYCRMLGIPPDVVDATEHLLALADRWRPRRVDLGRVNDRHFLFSSGVGLDASVVRLVDSHPRAKARLGEWYYGWAAVRTFTGHYLLRPPRLRAVLGETAVQGVTAIVQNADPYTYFGDRPVRMGIGAALDSGDLAGVVLERASALQVPSIAARAMLARDGVAGERRVRGFGGVQALAVCSADDRPLPLQVDGDYIGNVREARYRCLPGALTVVC
ncbi:MAG: diacylglycerol/lipid kinase family protein [Solirubrobacteraceae bacterium]